MLLIKSKRVIKSGFMNFWRNGWVSLAAILVMVVTLFAIGSIIFSRVILGSVLKQIENKVDISVYFKTKTTESDIADLKKSLELLPEVKTVDYVSETQALADFKEIHKDSPLTLQALEQLDENPFGAILNIRAKEVSQYESVAKFLEGESATVKGKDAIIDKVNYFQNKKIIDSLSRIIASTKKLGASMSIVFIIISILVTFNTLGLVIYTSREEIEVMRLVGASNRFVRGPFIIEGAMYGVISSIITMVIFWPLTLWLGPSTAIGSATVKNFFGEVNLYQYFGVDIYQYYINNFGQIFFGLARFRDCFGSRLQFDRDETIFENLTKHFSVGKSVCYLFLFTHHLSSLFPNHQ